MSSIAIITARGGSKRIPNKNIKEFCGKPIIQYSIEAAQMAGIFDEIMVSTDSPKIASVCKEFGVNIPFMRSEKNADDFATTSDVLMEVLEQYEKQGKYFDNVCCIYPTAPFVTAEKLQKGMKILEENEYFDAVVPVVQFSFPPQRAFHIVDNEVNIIYPDTFQMRSQDFEPIYHDCGQYYCMKVDSFKNIRSLVLSHTFPIITSETEVQDIDTIDDWEIAEIKFKRMMEKMA